ncbi:glutaredoxin family protein [Rhodoglobus aureus]|uniref:Mycoredoxin n=1 Tax=Rhodoglobus aureus TaxID=191497 RepID=A0ABN1VD56_9MICO
MSETTEALPTKITMFGADWCRDCVRSEALLNSLNLDWEKVDVEKDPSAADRAQAISGRLSIPVVHFTDGTFQVEPSDRELKAKLEELGAI